jgi:tetrahydromethanopterin S-methyltransferase subunit B
MPHLSLSEEDIDKIATAVKQKITVDIESIITAKIEPLIFRISKLERENNELMANLDSLEQYGRRSLI